MNVLLVEDDVGIGRFVSRGLMAQGHQVAWERSGERVRDLVATDRFGVMLLDLGLPDIDGIDLCRSVREDARIPILMLTARGTLQDRLDGFDAGADDYLPKPFAFDELIARLRVVERRQADAIAPPLRVAKLEVDAVRRRMRWDGREVEFTRRSFDLLACLAAARGDAVARRDLIEAVWGSENEVSDNNLDVQVSALRQRLRQLDLPLTVETVRALGFRLTVTEPK